MSLEADAKTLGNLKIFSLLENEAVKMLAFQAETVSYESGDIIFNFGEKSLGGLVIKSGKIALDGSTDETPQLAKILEAGALIGQLALITDVTHRAQAKAIEPVTILQIQRTSFQRILREYPDCAAKIRSEIASDLLGFTKSLDLSRRNSA